MKVQLVSDLHLEHQVRGFGLYTPEYLGEEFLILAGDINCGLNNRTWFANLLEHRNVIYIMGNHEGYGFDLQKLLNDFSDFGKMVNIDAESRGFKYKIYCMQNETLTVGNIKFICGTLWTDYKNENPMIQLAVYRGLNDYYQIRYDGFRLGIPTVLAEHKKTRQFIQEELNNTPKELKKVVITHHLPSYNCVNPKYKNIRDDDLNWAYCSNLDEMAMQADVWMHGHSHTALEIEIGNCKVYCNPRGYPGEETGFQSKIIEI